MPESIYLNRKYTTQFLLRISKKFTMNRSSKRSQKIIEIFPNLLIYFLQLIIFDLNHRKDSLSFIYPLFIMSIRYIFFLRNFRYLSSSRNILATCLLSMSEKALNKHFSPAKVLKETLWRNCANCRLFHLAYPAFRAIVSKDSCE